jgi:PAS domain S-box-containing protein
MSHERGGGFLLGEIQEILIHFGGGGGDPGNEAVRFLLAAFFWLVLASVSLQQFRQNSDRRDLYIAAAGLIGLVQNLVVFFLEYGAERGFVHVALSLKYSPPLEHGLNGIGEVFLGFAYLRYFLPGRDPGKRFLRIGLATFILLYAVMAPLWVRFLEQHPEIYTASGSKFGHFWGNQLFRFAASSLTLAVVARLASARRKGAPIPAALFIAFGFLFLDEFLMLLNLTVGKGAWYETLAPLRHNLYTASIPLFLAAYWGELFRRLRDSEAARRRSEERYRSLVENIELGITLVDRDFRIVMVNGAQASAHGKDPGALAGRECFREFHGRETPCPECHGAQAMATGRPVTRVTEKERADGGRTVRRIRTFPVQEEAGEPHGFIEVVEDITEEHEAREAHERLEEKVRQGQKLESLGVLAGGIAHDFNNLLVSMLGNVDLALGRLPQDSAARPFLQAADGAAQRAADLTNQMLAYSGKGRFVVGPADLSALVAETAHLLEAVVSKRAAFRLDLPDGLPPVEADATQLRQVAMNLITNASDALEGRDGRIDVSTRLFQGDPSGLPGLWYPEPPEPGRYVLLEVSDTGCGMDEATLKRIFDPFFTTKQSGRGLGLAAVLGIVRSHGGGMGVESEPGKGTTFRVLIPPLVPHAQPARRPSAVPEGPAAPRGGTVLLADDEPYVLDVARAMLEGAGYDVLVAADGEEAVERFREMRSSVELVVLDVTMPRMNGEEAFREIRRIDPTVPVLFSSGYSEPEAVERFLGKGLAGFIQKPYRTAAFISKVEAVLAERRTP